MPDHPIIPGQVATAQKLGGELKARNDENCETIEVVRQCERIKALVLTDLSAN